MANIDRPSRPSHEDIVSQELALLFAPLHKRAFGMAVGIAVGLLIWAMTVVHVVFRPEPALRISLLSQYFYGYTVTWAGAFVGLFWGFVVGFVGGWFVAFARNLSVAISIFLTKTRAELNATRDFLDHI